MFVITGPDGVPDCAVSVFDQRRAQGAFQVAPTRNWCFCHMRLRVSPVKLLVELPRTVPMPAIVGKGAGLDDARRVIRLPGAGNVARTPACRC